MADFLADLIDKTDDDIFDKFFTDKTAIKFVIEDKLRNIKKNKSKVFGKLSHSGYTMGAYRFALLELDKINTKPIINAINSGTFKYDMTGISHYTKRFHSDFPLSNRDSVYYQKFWEYMFEHKDDKNLYLKTLIKDFYKTYANSHPKFAHRVDVSDLTKLLHFIRKGKTPLYNTDYVNFFCLRSINEIADTDSSIPSQQIMDEKIEIFEKQYYFIRAIFEEIITQSRPSAKTPKNNPYNFSELFDDFNDYFYITDNGVTKHKIVDYCIWKYLD